MSLGGPPFQTIYQCLEVAPGRRGPVVPPGLRAHQSTRPLCLFGAGSGPTWATTSPPHVVRSDRGAFLIPLSEFSVPLLPECQPHHEQHRSSRQTREFPFGRRNFLAVTPNSAQRFAPHYAPSYKRDTRAFRQKGRPTLPGTDDGQAEPIAMTF
jgi:hypothetical protein